VRGGEAWGSLGKSCSGGSLEALREKFVQDAVSLGKVDWNFSGIFPSSKASFTEFLPPLLRFLSDRALRMLKKPLLVGRGG